MQSNYKDVEDFSEKFDIPKLDVPDFLDLEAHDFRVKFMEEELQEFIDATKRNDLGTAADSLIDLVYVAMGTAVMMGLTDEDWQELWNDVQRANMSKERCTDSAKSTRGTTLDVIKPTGWREPQSKQIIKDIIERKKDENTVKAIMENNQSVLSKLAENRQ